MPIGDLMDHEYQKRFSEGDKRMDNLETKTNTMQCDITEMKTALIGNFDKPGAITILKETASIVKEMKTNKKDWSRWADRLVLASILGLVIWMIQTKIKIG